MSLDKAPHNPVSPSLDDAYWSALFQEEEQAVAPPITDLIELERPSPDIHPVNGQIPASANALPNDPWQEATAVQTHDRSLELLVTGCNKGGLIVYWRGLQGFIPASQLVDFPQFHLEATRVQALKKWVNQRLTVKIVDVNPEKNRLVFSERAALVDADTRHNVLQQLEVGQAFTGKVTNLTPFGAFVDLGGVEGLAHISELSWSRVTHPSDIVQPGQEIKVKVLSIDPDNGRVALSLKQLRPNPWETAKANYHPGQHVTGTVSNIVHYGAFILLEEELEGLIHISELAEGTFLHPRNVVQLGETVTAVVLSVNARQKRLALSLKKAQPRSTINN